MLLFLKQYNRESYAGKVEFERVVVGLGAKRV